MENYDNRAFNEVVEILKHTDISLTKRISKNFLNFLIENVDTEYETNINFYDENWEDSILDDTKKMMALIYRDYIMSDDERQRIVEEDREKYNPDYLFEKKDNEVIEQNTNLPMEMKKETFLKKIINFIKNLFMKKN